MSTGRLRSKLTNPIKAEADTNQAENAHAPAAKTDAKPAGNVHTPAARPAAAAEPVKRRRRPRKIKDEDRAYQPQSSQNHRSDVLGMRCDKATLVGDKENAIPVITSFMVNLNEIVPTSNTLFTPTRFNAAVSSTAQNSTSYRPILTVTATNAADSPVKIDVFSPIKGTVYQLERDEKIGPVSLFSNRGLVDADTTKKEIATELAARDDFYKSEQYKSIRKQFAAIKQQSLQVTKQSLNKTARLNALNNHQRVPNQNTAMSGSATDYATATKLFIPNLKWEWLHLIAHELAGQQAQTANNLVAGTYHANTNMIFVERELAGLAARYPNGFTLETEVNLVEIKPDQALPVSEYLQVGTALAYKIVTDDFSIQFDFNVQNPTQPHIDYKHYIHAMFDAIEKVTAAKTQEASTIDERAIPHFFKR